ncbi:MAG TPA: exopolysaccharide biosynthesis polyprenyl glycosylphosphotransferase [Candidatus Portnoybacteria bacterium]|nr:exopolysaccharide biosynthesis polyprenyl glycosylphosphotransferase [Candidatus Portnoybacteria bacterium]
MGNKVKQRFFIFLILAGDLVVLYFSLWLALLLRYLKLPSQKLFQEHFWPFSLLFIVWLLVFYIADLYGRSFYLGKKKILGLLLKSQLTNSVIAVFFFYLSTFYDITPKTILFVDLVASFALLLLWRLFIGYLLKFGLKKKLVLIGSGAEFEELAECLAKNDRYGFRVIAKIDSRELSGTWEKNGRKSVEELIAKNHDLAFVVDSMEDLPPEVISYFYDRMFLGQEFIDFQKLYQDIFQYVPLSFVDDKWLLANISSGRDNLYDLPKRLVDIIFSLVSGLISLVFYPFIILAIKINDGGPVFFVNERIGQKNKVFKQIKFRTMCVNAKASWIKKDDKQITRIGSFLRRTRLDELPQFWNVLKGDMSFVGPRPDFIEFTGLLESKIPYYNIRSLIKPGLTGWAQTQQLLPPRSVEETQKRLAYDIYYIKNRSLFLDITIILQTIRTVLSTSGT